MALRSPRLGPAAVLLTTVIGAGAASAGIIKPNIMIIFDTSGTMLTNSGGGRNGDGSVQCGGVDTTSRVYNLKEGLRSALQVIGYDEANFGLMRFPQLNFPALTPLECNPDGSSNSYTCGGVTCDCAGHYCTRPSVESYGCWMSSDTSGANTSYGPWFDSSFSEVFLVPVTKVNKPTSTTDYDPADGNVADVVAWVDQYESPADSGATSVPDPELRVLNNTPSGRTLFYARLYFENYVKPLDPESLCRKNVVIFATDDDVYRHCNVAGSAVPGFDNTTCTGSGATDNDPQVSACKLFRNSGVQVYVLTNTGAGATNSPVAVAGGTSAAVEVDLTNKSAIQAALLDIIAKSVPPGESCNCADDDCNVTVDEPWAATKGTACSVGVGECKRDGVYGCDGTGGGLWCIASGAPSLCGQAKLVPGPVGTEICNGKDDNCNGIVDDGVPGGCTCVMSTEVCNGKDDNCNGMTDEKPTAGEGTTCGSSKGICTPGTYECTAGKLTCKGGTGPGTEVCNGLDDNCNGATDETDPEAGKKCYPPATSGCVLATDSCVGLCRFGSKVCESGMMKCKFAQGPVPEKCNGLDDDCDGTVDNGFDVGTACDNGKIGSCKRVGTKVCSATGGTTCTAPPGSGTAEVCNGMDDDCDGMTDEGGPLPGEGLPCGVGLGECMSGTTKCKMGMIVCDGGKGPMPEICDGKDNNCNGLVDEGVPGEGMDCVCPGLDPKLVGMGECKGGKTVCKGTMGFACEGCTFPGMEICNGKDDDCDGSTDTAAPCPGGFGCRNGECSPECKPGEFPCPAGQKCDKGYCVPEPCAGVDCGGRMCKEGKCIDPCAEKMCSALQTCVEGICHDCYTDGCPNPADHCELGVCKPDPCNGVVCRVAEFCNGGICLPTCDNLKCASGQRCVGGVCRGDACVGVACQSNEFCDPSTGECRFNPCKTIMCPTGQTCVPSTGMCGPDPCEKVFCNRDCLHCEVTADGTADCVGPLSCQIPQAGPPVSGGGGGGCTTCAVGSRVPDGDGGGGAGVTLLLALAAIRRRRPR